MAGAAPLAGHRSAICGSVGHDRPQPSRLAALFDTDGCGAGALARWFCGQWSARNAVGGGPLSHVVVGVVGASGTHSPRAANRSLDDGFGGVFYSAVAEPKEFSFQCDGR